MTQSAPPFYNQEMSASVQPIETDKPPAESILDEDPVADEQVEGPGVKAWQAWKVAPSPATMSAAVKSVNPAIQTAISRFPKINATVAGGEARRLAISAIKTYDPTQGTSLSSHVFNHLRGLQRFVQEKARDVVSVPRSAREEFTRLRGAESAFLEERGRYPSEPELQDLTGFAANKMKRLRGMAKYDFAEGALEAQPDVSKGDDGTIGLWSHFVYHDLNPRDQLIMDYKMGHNGRETLGTEEIAKRTGLHPTYVNRRAAEIAQKILDGANQTRNLSAG